MAVYISTYPDASAWLSDLTANLLPSNNWLAAKNAEFQKVFRIPLGGNVGLSVSGSELKMTAFEHYCAELGIVEQSPFPGLPGLDLPTSAVDTWTCINERRVCGVLRSNGIYHSFYFGLIRAFGSERTYPFPVFVGGSAGNSAYPFMCGGSSFCPKVCVPDGTFQEVGGSQGRLLTSFSSFDCTQKVSYLSPFDGKFKRIGANLDGSVTLFRTLVVSSKFVGSSVIPISMGPQSWSDGDADDGPWLGYLDGIYACPVTLAPGAVFAVDGVNFLVVKNSGSADVFAMELS